MDTQSLQQADEVVSALETLRTRLTAQHDDESAQDVLTRASQLIEQLRELVSTLDGQLAAMRWLAQKQYRPKSEKVPPGQLALDLLGYLMQQAQGEPATAAPPAPLPPVPDPPARLKREKRKSQLHLLPVEPITVELAESARRCDACGELKSEIGFEPKRHIIYQPARLFIREERLIKYACRACGDGVICAHGTPKLIEGSNASSSLLAHLVVSKVVDTTPIERVGKQLSRHGADIASSTLHDWFGRSGQEVEVLQPVAHQQLLRCGMISLDDSPLPAKHRDSPHGIQRGRLWLYVGDVSDIAYCEYTPDWKGDHPQRVLRGFAGPIQNDGYGGIHRLFTGDDPPTRVGCNDHCRRKFVDALQRGDKRPEAVIAIYGALYAVEREAKELSPDERLALRATKSTPLWQALRVEVDRLATLGERKSPLGKAITYFVRQEPCLSAFLSNGHLPISNAHVERLLRTVALFRRNSLFVGSPDAGPRYAALLTLALNCTLRDVNPYSYFVELFDRLAGGWPRSRIADLLPQRRIVPDQALKQPQA